MSQPRVETSDKQVQTIIHCFPHVLLNPEDTAKVSCDRGCQTAASTSPQTENSNFYGILEYIPYQVIVEDSAKVLDLPRKAFLQWNLPSSPSQETYSGSSIDASESGRHIKHGSDTFRYKGVLKKLTSPSVDQQSYNNRPATHPIMQKSYSSKEIQTVLTVLPHVLESDEVANVYTELAIQTSITCLPNVSNSTIVPKLQANLTHDVSSTQTDDIMSAKSSKTVDTNSLYETNQNAENVSDAEPDQPLEEVEKLSEAIHSSKSDQLIQEQNEPLETQPEVETASEEINNVEVDKLVQNNQSSTSNFSSQSINQEGNRLLNANEAIAQGSAQPAVMPAILSKVSGKSDTKSVKSSDTSSETTCKCHTEAINKIANKMRVQATTLQLTPKVFPSTTKFEERMADVLNTTIAILQTEMAKLMEVYIEDESLSTSSPAIDSRQKDSKLCICETSPENRKVDEKAIAKISTTREVFDSSKTAPSYMQENVLEETTKRTIFNNDNETVIEENIRRTIVRGKTPEPESSDEPSVNINTGPYPRICGTDSLPNGDARNEFTEADKSDTMLDDTTPPFEYSEVIGDDTSSEEIGDGESKTLTDGTLSSEESETITILQLDQIESAEPHVTITENENEDALAPLLERPLDEREPIPSTSIPLTETGDYKGNKRFISIPCECHPTAAGAAPPTLSLDDLPAAADENTNNADSQPETTVKFELLMKKSINDVASVSAESAIVIRATISSPNLNKSKKENVKPSSSLPDLRDQVIRLSVIYKNGPEPEIKVEELCTACRTTQIQLSSREITTPVNKPVSVTESFIQNTLYECAKYASTTAKSNAPIHKTSPNVLSETHSNRTVVAEQCNKKVSNLQTEKKDSGFKVTVSYNSDSKSPQSINKNCKCKMQKSNKRMDEKPSAKSINSSQQTNTIQSSTQNTKSGQGLDPNAQLSKNNRAQDPDSLTCECNELSYPSRPDVIVVPVPSFNVVKNAKLSYATFQNNYIPSTVCNCQNKKFQNSSQQTKKSIPTNYLFSSPIPIPTDTHSETDSSVEANLEIRITLSAEDNSKENTLNDLSLTYEEDTVYEEPYMETLIENNTLTLVPATANKLNSDSLDSFTTEDDTNLCTCITEMPWGRISLPSPGTYSIKPINGLSVKENPKINNKDTKMATEISSETPPPAEPGPVNKRVLKNKEKLLYEDELIKHNEPYMEGLYKDFPNSDDDDDANCNSKTEIPWKDILLPDDCQIKNVKKIKKCMCRSNLQTLSNMLLPNAPQKELQTSTEKANIETVISFSKLSNKVVSTGQQKLADGNSKISYCSSGATSRTSGNKVSQSDGAEQQTCQTYDNLSKQTADDISSSIIVNIKSSGLSFSTYPINSSTNETDTPSDILKDVFKKVPKTCVVKKSNSTSAICGKASVKVKISLKELTTPNNVIKKVSPSTKQGLKNPTESKKQDSSNVRSCNCQDVNPVIAALNAYEAEMKPLRDTLTTLQNKIRNLNMLEKTECKCTTGINNTEWNFGNTRLTSSKLESNCASSGSSFKPSTGFSTYSNNTTNAYTCFPKTNFYSTPKTLTCNSYLPYRTLPTCNQSCAPSIKYLHPVRYQQAYNYNSAEIPLHKSKDRMQSNYASPSDDFSSEYNNMFSNHHVPTQKENLSYKDSYYSNYNNKYKSYYSESPNKINKQKHKARKRFSSCSTRTSSSYDYHSSDSSNTQYIYTMRSKHRKDDKRSKQKWISNLKGLSKSNSYKPKSSTRPSRDYFDETILRSGQAVKTDPDDLLNLNYQPKKKSRGD